MVTTADRHTLGTYGTSQSPLAGGKPQEPLPRSRSFSPLLLLGGELLTERSRTDDLMPSMSPL